MNKEQADIISKHILANNIAKLESNDFIRFITSTTVGYIPSRLVDYFIETGNFQFNGKDLKFSEGIDGFDQKSVSIDKVNSAMVEAGAIKEKPSHFAHEERAVGDQDRLVNPEFRINRAYDFVLGLQVDAVSLQISTTINGEHLLILQKRGGNVVASGKLDSTASGAVKYPEKNFVEALSNQLDHEVGKNFSKLSANAVFGASIYLSLSLNKNGIPAVQRIRKGLYDLHVDEETANQILTQSTEEAETFQFATPSEIIDLCCDETIPPVLVQSFMTSLIVTGLMPKSDFTSHIKSVLQENGGCMIVEKPKGIKPSKGLCP